MTEKLYYADSHLTECTARVLSCEPAEKGFDVRLDRTVFFPEAGGQPSDQGTIDTVRLLHAREDGEDIVHLADGPLPVGKSVALNLDWARRFDFMQQHTGEHLLSFAFYTLFHANNIGFHLAETDYTTIDFDMPLDAGQLAAAQLRANEFIWRDLGVSATLYGDAADIRALPLRKHAEGLTAPIRIVAVEDADMCTCCAPHCKRTGEIGQLLITDAMAYKGGTRVFFVCGKRALAYASAAHAALDGVARRFSCARPQAAAALDKLFADYASARHNEKTLTTELNTYVVKELADAAEPVGRRRLILRLLPNVDAARLKSLAQGALSDDTLCVLLSETGGRLAYVVACSEGFSPDAGELIQAVNAAAGGKGGGRGTLAQGMAPSAAGVTETLGQLRHYFMQRLK